MRHSQFSVDWGQIRQGAPGVVEDGDRKTEEVFQDKGENVLMDKARRRAQFQNHFRGVPHLSEIDLKLCCAKSRPVGGKN